MKIPLTSLPSTLPMYCGTVNNVMLVGNLSCLATINPGCIYTSNYQLGKHVMSSVITSNTDHIMQVEDVTCLHAYLQGRYIEFRILVIKFCLIENHANPYDLMQSLWLAMMMIISTREVYLKCREYI